MEILKKRKEKKITYVLEKFINELSKSYKMTNKEKDNLIKIASEDISKLYDQTTR